MVDIEDIDVGALPDDGTGDPERDAFIKTNAIAEGLRQHRADIANPHGTTAEQVGTYTKATIETKLNDLKVEVQTGTVSPAQLAEVLKGVVVASATGSITLVEGAARTLTLTETTRSAFEPGTFAALTRKASIADYAVIRPTAYDPATGLLAFTIEKAVGGAGPFTDWEVASLAGPTIAQLALLTQGYAAQAAAESARDLARDWATKTTGEVAPGLGFGSKKYAQDSAASAAAAKTSADLAAQFDPTTYQRTTFNIARFSAADGNLTGGQAVFPIAPGYTVGSAQVFLSGIRLSGPEFTALNGTSVTLGSGVDAGDVVEIVTFVVNGILDVAPLHHAHPIEDLPPNLALKSEVAAVSAALAAKLDASAKATTAQAQAGTDDAVYMTPAGVAAAIARLSPLGPTLDDVRTLAVQLAKLKGSTVGMAAGVADDFKDQSGVAFPDPALKSLLHFDGANGSTAFTDETGKVFATAGSPALTTARAKFGTASLGLNGASCLRLTHADFAITATGTWTAEAWVYPTTLNSSNTLFHFTNSSGSGLQIGINPDGSVMVNRSTSGDYTGAAGIIPTNVWSKIEVSCAAGTVYVFANGTLLGTTSVPFAASDRLYIGGYLDAGTTPSRFFTGSMDEVRVSVGVARHAATYAPETGPFPGGGDSVNATYDGTNNVITNVSTFTGALLHLDGVNSSTAIVDECGHTFSAFGTNAKLSTTQQKFGTASLILSSVGDYILSPANADYGFGTGDFTVEMWINPASVAQGCIFDSRATDSGAIPGFVMNVQGGKLNLYDAPADSNINGTITISANVWTHVAATRTGGFIRTFVNGVLDRTVASSSNVGASLPAKIGLAIGGQSTTQYTGYIDEVRIIKGSAAYTASFTPPTAPFALGNLALNLRSVAFAAAAVPAKGSIFALVSATAGAITPNTNLLADISRDGGTTWTTGTLVSAGAYGGFTMYEANGFDISGQPSGTSMKWRLRTVGTVLGVAVDAVVAQWG